VSLIIVFTPGIRQIDNGTGDPDLVELVQALQDDGALLRVVAGFPQGMTEGPA
jgi:hypothetical protein